MISPLPPTTPCKASSLFRSYPLTNQIPFVSPSPHSTPAFFPTEIQRLLLYLWWSSKQILLDTFIDYSDIIVLYKVLFERV